MNRRTSTLCLRSEDYLAVILDILAHSRETADSLPASPEASPECARLSCAGLGAPPNYARDLAERLCRMFELDSADLRLGPSASFEDWADSLQRATAGRPENVGFLSSGSTGESRLYKLPFVALEQEVRILAPRLPFLRVCSVVPRYHCFGFVFGLLLPRLADLPRRSFPSLPTTELTVFLRPGDLLAGFPFFFDALARVGANLTGVMPLTAGSPCPPALTDALLAAGADGVREIYGASELSAVGFRHIRQQGEASDLPFTLLPQWQRTPQGLIRRNEDGSASSLAPLPDSLDWRGEREFRVLARIDEAVQVGGRNVYPGQVRAVLEEHPAVSRCRVRLMRPDEGWRLKAFVVPAKAPGDEAESARLRALLLAWCRERLPSEAVPKALTFGAGLPCNSFGKDADW